MSIAIGTICTVSAPSESVGTGNVWRADRNPLDPTWDRCLSPYSDRPNLAVGETVEVLEAETRIPWVRRIGDDTFHVVNVNKLTPADQVATSAANLRGEVFKVGDAVEWTKYGDQTPPQRNVGDRATVTALFGGEGRGQWVCLDNDYETGYRGRIDIDWLTHVAERPGRPTVTLPEGKTRDNAVTLLDAVGEHLPSGPNAFGTLSSAAAGAEVDAAQLNWAATLALSAVADNVREARRRTPLTSAARSILHRTGAILDNHLDALPAYETGVRSRKIAELEAALEVERQSVRDLRQQRSDRNNQITEIEQRVEQIRTEVEVRAAESDSLRRESDRLSALLVQRDARIVSLKRDVSAQAKTLRFLQAHSVVGEQVTSLVDAFRAGRRSK